MTSGLRHHPSTLYLLQEAVFVFTVQLSQGRLSRGELPSEDLLFH